MVSNNALLAYGTHPSAPPIELPKVQEFKDDRGRDAEKYFQSEINQLNEKYQRLLSLAKDTQMVYSARYNFVPKIGPTYHLYYTGKEYMLSLIDNWDRFKHVGSFVLTHNNVWKRIS